MVLIKLSEGLVNSQNKPLKDATQETRSAEHLEKLTQQERLDGLPTMTFGQALSLILGSKRDCKNMAETAKFSRLIAKINNKNITGKKEWDATALELKDLKECLDGIVPIKSQQIADPGFDLNILMHGQVYNRLEEYLTKLDNAT